jgi:hypothetical protein
LLSVHNKCETDYVKSKKATSTCDASITMIPAPLPLSPKILVDQKELVVLQMFFLLQISMETMVLWEPATSSN